MPGAAGATHTALQAGREPLPPAAIWLLYELSFTVLAVVRRAGARGAGDRATVYLRAVWAYVLLYYALWATADVLIMSGAGAGWALRIVPNQLYYVFVFSVLTSTTRADGIGDLRSALAIEASIGEGVAHPVPGRCSRAPYRGLTGACDAPLMIVAFPEHPDKRYAIPSAVHVDGTVGPQTIEQHANPRFHALLSEVGKRTGHPVMLNTSFNVRGEPIVCTPLDAARCFYSTGLDVMRSATSCCESSAALGLSAP